MKKARSSRAPIVFALFLSGCVTDGTNITALQQAMDANHKAAISVLKKMNDEDLPYRIDDGITRSSFSKDDLSVLAPADIAAWDKNLSALDSYCAALSNLTSGKESADFTTASESFGSNILSLAKAAGKKASPQTASIETAVTELGSVLIRLKAESDARKIAKEANASFQAVIQGLIGALGFEGNPPVESAHGILATYEVDFAAGTASTAKEFKDGSIAGFATMSGDSKRASIKNLIGWLSTEQDHDDFVASFKTLVAALNKAGLAHAALANGSGETASAALAQLKSEIQNVKGIYQKFSKG